MADQQNASGQPSDQGKIQIQLAPEMQAGSYANAVSVSVNVNEVVIDLGYLLPNSNPRTIKVVSRVNMNHRTAESFMRILQDALLDFRNKQKENPAK